MSQQKPCLLISASDCSQGQVLKSRTSAAPGLYDQAVCSFALLVGLWLAAEPEHERPAARAAEPIESIAFDDAVAASAREPLYRATKMAALEKQATDKDIPWLTSNPALTASVGPRLSPASQSGVDLIVSLVQGINVAGHGAARRAAANSESAVLAARAQALALQTKLHAARVWLDVWVAQMTLEQRRQEAVVAEERMRKLERAANVGGVTSADVAMAGAYLAEARLRTRDAEGVLIEHGLMLSQVVGAPAKPLRAHGGLPEVNLQPPQNWQAAIAEARNLPAPRAAHLMSQAEHSRVAEERAARGTSLLIGGQVQRESPNSWIAQVTVGASLPLFERGQREVGLRRAEATTLLGAADAAARSAAVELALAAHEVEHTQEVLREVQDGLVPATRQVVTLHDRVLGLGAVTALEVLQARREAIAAAETLQQAQAAHVWAKLKLALLLASLEGVER